MTKIIKGNRVIEPTPASLTSLGGALLTLVGSPSPPIQFAASDATTALTASTPAVVIYAPNAMTITEVFCSLGTAQASGSIFTVDIKKNGTTILSTLVTIDNTETTSLTAATQPVISVTSLAKGDAITCQITQIGNGSAKQLAVTINGTRA